MSNVRKQERERFAVIRLSYVKVAFEFLHMLRNISFAFANKLFFPVLLDY